MGRLNPERTIRNLQRLWWLHDGLWFQAVAERFGPEVANELNHQAAQIVAKRAMRLTGARKGPLTVEEIADRFAKAAELMWAPSMMRWEERVLDERTIEIEVANCYAVNGLRRSGLLKDYRCACLAVRRGWFEALGIQADQEILRTMRDGAPSCLIRIRLK